MYVKYFTKFIKCTLNVSTFLSVLKNFQIVSVLDTKEIDLLKLNIMC